VASDLCREIRSKIMTPRNYLQKFRDLDVFIFSSENPASFDEGKWVRTSVLSYRLGVSYDPARNPLPSPGPDGIVGARKIVHPYQDDLTSAVKGHTKIKVKVKRIDGVEETGEHEYTDLSYGLVAPFSGKGYPEEIQLLLQDRYRYQKTKIALEEFVKQQFIGLDCNGFVGGYLERRNAPTNWLRTKASKTSMPIRDILGPEHNFLKSWDDLRPPGLEPLLLGLCSQDGTVMDHTDDGGVGHIAITEPSTLRKEGAKGPVKVYVAEATGDGVGLTYSEYQVLSMTLDPRKRAIFYVHRDSKRGMRHEYVYFRIAPAR
jgi:hypothetical protein